MMAAKPGPLHTAIVAPVSGQDQPPLPMAGTDHKIVLPHITHYSRTSIGDNIGIMENKMETTTMGYTL